MASKSKTRKAALSATQPETATRVSKDARRGEGDGRRWMRAVSIRRMEMVMRSVDILGLGDVGLECMGFKW